jgi:hypothetical protein
LLTGYLPADRQGISDFGSEGWGFPACWQTGNPFAVTNKTKYHIKSSSILEVIYVVLCFSKRSFEEWIYQSLRGQNWDKSLIYSNFFCFKRDVFAIANYIFY